MTKIIEEKNAVNSDPTKSTVATPRKKPAAAKAATAAKPAVIANAKSDAPRKAAAVARPVAKSQKPPAVAPAKVKPVSEPKEKVKKPRLVRDSFTMPEIEYQVLGDVKRACLKAGVAVKKSELLRVGVALIQKLDVAKLKEAVAALSPLKAGRPKSEK